MLKNVLTIHSTISSHVMKHVLMKGFIFAFVGVLALVLGAVFFSTPVMQKWGFLLFLFSMGLITYGLLPYRRLSRLQLHPDILYLLDSNSLEYYSKKKKIMTIPLKAIDEMVYLSHPIHYGIAITLKKLPGFPVIVHLCPKKVQMLRKEGEKQGANLFLPYFNQHAYRELKEVISEEEAS